MTDQSGRGNAAPTECSYLETIGQALQKLGLKRRLAQTMQHRGRCAGLLKERIEEAVYAVPRRALVVAVMQHSCDCGDPKCGNVFSLEVELRLDYNEEGWEFAHRKEAEDSLLAGPVLSRVIHLTQWGVWLDTDDDGPFVLLQTPYVSGDAEAAVSELIGFLQSLYNDTKEYLTRSPILGRRPIETTDFATLSR